MYHILQGVVVLKEADAVPGSDTLNGKGLECPLDVGRYFEYLRRFLRGVQFPTCCLLRSMNISLVLLMIRSVQAPSHPILHLLQVCLYIPVHDQTNQQYVVR